MKIESGIWIGIWIWDSKLRLGLGKDREVGNRTHLELTKIG